MMFVYLFTDSVHDEIVCRSDGDILFWWVVSLEMWAAASAIKKGS